MGRGKTARRKRSRRQLHQPGTLDGSASSDSSSYSQLSTRDRLSSMHGDIAILLMVAAVVVAIATVDDYRGLRRLQEHGIPATATVVDVHYRKNFPNEPEVRFTTRDGVAIEARVGVHRWDGPPEIDDSRQVLYDPLDPVGGVLDRRAKFVHATHWLSAAVVLLLVPLAIATWRLGPRLFGWSRMESWRRRRMGRRLAS
ncbi:DUF3592 domain-containing protein [Sphaerisporangium dianthi]|uniref:DUF3592 domain-containing protein n=1 Tax=Sphaerisporangium dianthi TaxID=1436120 RepID=A0ABV9CC24_9ACTN